MASLGLLVRASLCVMSSKQAPWEQDSLGAISPTLRYQGQTLSLERHAQVNCATLDQKPGFGGHRLGTFKGGSRL